MNATTMQAPTVELPEKLYMIVTHYPPPKDVVGPLFLPFPPEEPVAWGLPVFEHRAGAEEFAASPNFDVPAHIIKEISLEHFIRAGENPIDIAREHGDEDEFFYMVDPRPMHEWESAEDMGYVIRMQDAAKMLREELAE